MNELPPEQLALEIEDLIRTMPGPRDLSVNPDKCLPWLGRANAAMRAWNAAQSVVRFEPLALAVSTSGRYFDSSTTHRNMLVQLYQAQSDLRLRTTGLLSVGLGSGQVFDYFDEVRKLIESAKVDILFVDPYLDAEFVSRYLPHVSSSTLKSAATAFSAQTNIQVEIRIGTGFHDRYIFVDGLACYQSGASFKDGARKTPTTLTQITDAFTVVQLTYENLWAASNPA
jgi:hypothetical protein